jgi:hypothetical protein
MNKSGMRIFILFILFSFSTLFISKHYDNLLAEEEQEKPRLLVIPLKAKGKISQDEAYLLTELLSVEIHKSGIFTILNRDEMKEILTEKEFELAMGCDDNVCLLENVAKLAVNKIIAGSIGALGKRYIISIRLIDEDGQNEIMEKDICDCPLEQLTKSIERISYKFLKYLGGEPQKKYGSIRVESKPSRSKIYVDGDELGATPDTIGYIEPGKHEVEVKMNNYKEWSKNVNIEAGEEKLITAILQKETRRVGLRSSYSDLSVSQVQSMPHISIRSKEDWGFYGHSTIKHDYEVKRINGDNVVIEHATELMWHQSGSYEGMYWEKAKQWVNELNSRRYAGYSDWRLPTAEEAASLLKSSKKNGDLYIDPVFDQKQRWIWTGDSELLGGVWIVEFSIGRVIWFITDDDYYVRPVRSAK